jgi:long-chain acyl-CoA synthetase
LTITDRKKDLFKLSTGKYVMPQPLENNLSSEAIIDQSVVIGDGHKFAAALIFPNPEHLRILGRTLGLPANTSLPDLCSNEQVIKQVGLLVDRANEGLPHWSTIKRFSIVPGELTVENELLTRTLKVKRSAVKARFLSEIEALYQDENAEDLQDTTS